MNNPFITLCHTSSKKNIDSNFVKTLEALLFLNSKNVGTLINAVYPVEMYITIDSNTAKSKWFQEKINQKTAAMIPHENHHVDYIDDDYSSKSISQALNNVTFRMSQPMSLQAHLQKRPPLYNKEVYKMHEEIHFGNFLMNKLSENFRRLYSANRRGGRVPKDLGSDINSLKEQQKNIYKCLDMIAPHIQFTNKSRTFDSIFFGKVRYCSEAQAFFYLSLHEHLLPENESIHKKIFDQQFNSEDIHPAIIQDVALLSYPEHKSKFIKEIITRLPNDFFREMSLYLSEMTKANSSFMADVFLHCAKNNIDIPKEQKSIILKNLLSSHSHWGKMPVEMAQPIVKEIRDYIHDVPLKFINSTIINPTLIRKNCVVDIALELVDKLDDDVLFLSSIVNTLEPQQQAILYSKYDFSNQETLFNIGKRISSSGEYHKKQKMSQFISVVGDYLEKETISNILALDFSFIEVIEPLYMTKRLNEELGKNDMENPKVMNQPKKLKI